MAAAIGSELRGDRYMQPVVETIAVFFRNDEVLLVRRANPPDAGHWGFPGGKMELGETIEAAAARGGSRHASERYQRSEQPIVRTQY